MRKISIFGIVVGVVLLLAYLALLLDLTAPESQPEHVDRKMIEKLSPGNYAVTGMALSATVILVSFLGKLRARAVGFVVLAWASILVACAALSVYTIRDVTTHFPYGPSGLAYFPGLSALLEMKTSWEVYFTSMVSPLAGGLVTVVVLAGVLHAGVKGENGTLLRILAGILGLIILTSIVCSALFVLQTTEFGERYEMSRNLPAREQAVAIYASLFALASLAVAILSILMLFLPARAQRCSRTALVLLWGMAVSLPLVWLGMVTWSGLAAGSEEHAYHAGNWLVLGRFMLINGILSILPLILFVSGVSLALREFSVSQRGGQTPRSPERT